MGVEHSKKAANYGVQAASAAALAALSFNLNPKSFMQKLSLPQVLFDWVFDEKNEVYVNMTESALTFHAPYHMNKLTVGLDLATIKAIKSGTASAMAKKLISEHTEQRIKKLMAAQAPDVVSAFPEPTIGPGIDEPSKQKPIPIPAKAPEPSICGLVQMKTDVPVPLLDAFKLYQPVRGSSQGSRYFYVGAFVAPDATVIKLAVRWRGEILSFRAEWSGTLSASSTAVIFNAGLIVQGNYASVHMTMPMTQNNDTVAAKCLGAVLGVFVSSFATGNPTIPSFQLLKAAADVL